MVDSKVDSAARLPSRAAGNAPGLPDAPSVLPRSELQLFNPEDAPEGQALLWRASVA